MIARVLQQRCSNVASADYQLTVGMNVVVDVKIGARPLFSRLACAVRGVITNQCLS
jgi:hypothetical protein